MKDPARLLDEGATPAELFLLRAGASEEPSEQAVRRLAVALGVAGSVVALNAATKSVAPGAVVRGFGSKIAAKWIVMGTIGLFGGAALVFAGAPVLRRAAAPAPHAAVPASRAVTPATVVSPDLAAGSSVGPSNGVANAAAAPDVGASAAVPDVRGSTPSSAEAVAAGAPLRSNPGSETSAGARSPSIAREIAALDAARSLLAKGDPHGALRALGDYEAATKGGVLRQEATLLRIEALSSEGELGAARGVARRFLRDNPHSPHEKRVRALIGESP